MDRTLISWNIPNIITIWLMAAIGFLIVGLLAQLAMKAMGGGSNQSQAVDSSAGM